MRRVQVDAAIGDRVIGVAGLENVEIGRRVGKGAGHVRGRIQLIGPNLFVALFLEHSRVAAAKRNARK